MGKGSGGCDRPAMTIAGGSITDTDVKILAQTAADMQAQAERELLEKIMNTTWMEPDPVDQLLARTTAEQLGVHVVTALRLEKEDFTGEDFSQYQRWLHPTRDDVSSPDETVIGMTDAARDCLATIEAGETIAIFGDYDVDGNTSGTIARWAVEAAGGNVIAGYASAKDGFGLTEDFINEVKEASATMLIVVDCGSSDGDTIAYAKSQGLKTVVIDHHDVDMANPTDHHLNPRYIQGLKHAEADEIRRRIKRLVAERTKINKRLNAGNEKEGDEDRLVEIELELDEAVGEANSVCPPRFGDAESPGHAIAKLENHLDNMMDDAMPTGARLTWQFGAALLQEKEGEIPEEWWGKPMYLAGTGALGDMADMLDIENRAFTRIPVDEFGLDSVPRGVQLLAEHFEESPLDPSGLIRTRATLNLAKRTYNMNASDIAAVYGEYGEQTMSEAKLRLTVAKLAAAHRESTEARKEMELLAKQSMAQWRTKRRLQKKSSQQKNWVHAVIDDPALESYVGQAGIIASGLAREKGLPAIVFTRQGVDAEGHTIMKWSSRNDQVSQKIGKLLGPKWKKQLLETAAIAQKNEATGEITYKRSVGGHEDVVSGSCRKGQIGAVMKILDQFASDARNSAEYKWRSPEYDRFWLTKRFVDGHDLDQLENESRALQPLAGKNKPVTVSVKGVFSKFGETDPDNGYTSAVLTADGVKKECQIPERLMPLARAGQLEVAFGVRPDSPYFIKGLRPILDA